MENGQNSNAEVVPVEEERPVVVTPVTPVAPPPARENNAVTDNSDVRTIAGGITVISGGPLKAYSVVVGSFWARERAEAMTSSLKDEGYNSCLVKTNETINGHTGWYRVIISSYDDKSSAAQLRSQLKNNKYPDAWLLYNK